MAVEQKTIEKVVTISARPETVFGYFTDPVKYVRWKGKRANLDPRPGGVFEVEFDKGEIARGEFVEVRRNQRVVFTWGWVGSATCPPGASRSTTIVFSPSEAPYTAAANPPGPLPTITTS